MPLDESRSTLELLYQTSRELASALDLRVVLTRVVQQAIKYVAGERGSLVVFDEHGNPMDAAIVIGDRVHEELVQQLKETTEHGLAGWVVKNRKPAWIPDTSRDKRWLHRPDDEVNKSGAKSALCVPLIVRDQVVGVLTLVQSTPGAFTQDHFDLAQAIADQAGIAILNARLYTESQRQARIMTAMVSSSAAINATLNLDDVLASILRETFHAMQVETVALALVEPTGELLFRDAISEGDVCNNVVGRKIPRGVGLAGQVMRDAQGVIVSNVEENKTFQPQFEQFSDQSITSVAYAPIFSKGKVIGLLAATNPISGKFGADALPVLSGIGNLAGSAIHNAQLYEMLQAAHKHFRELFDDSIDPILITDLQGNILEANQQAVALSGHSFVALKEMKITDLHQADKESVGENFGTLLNGLTCKYESFLKEKTGEELPVEVYVRLVKVDDTDGFQWIIRDIKARKELDSLREDMTSMIFHDVRSPLANVVSSLDLLTTLVGDRHEETLDSVLKIARRSTSRIQRLINSLLDINRLESGKTIGIQQVTPLPELVNEVIDMVTPMTEVRHQVVTTEIAADLPPLWVDLDMVRRVMVNLLENASKYSPPGGKLVIGGIREDGMARIWVQDNGPGIAATDQERIFEKYFRIKNQQPASGLGVGLAFCRLAVVAHGGRIWVESVPGNGSTFLITLPLAQEEPHVVGEEQ